MGGGFLRARHPCVEHEVSLQRHFPPGPSRLIYRTNGSNTKPMAPTFTEFTDRRAPWSFGPSTNPWSWRIQKYLAHKKPQPP